MDQIILYRSTGDEERERYFHILSYRKTPIISPGAYFWSKGLDKSSWGGGGGGAYIRGAYTWTNICVLKTLFFV